MAEPKHSKGDVVEYHPPNSPRILLMEIRGFEEKDGRILYRGNTTGMKRTGRDYMHVPDSSRPRGHIKNVPEKCLCPINTSRIDLTCILGKDRRS